MMVNDGGPVMRKIGLNIVFENSKILSDFGSYFKWYSQTIKLGNKRNGATKRLIEVKLLPHRLGPGSKPFLHEKIKLSEQYKADLVQNIIFNNHN